MTKKWLIPGLLALFVPSAVALSLHGYLGSFSRFMADDFCSAFIAERFGVLRAIWYWYLNWNGGISVTILGELMPLIKPAGMAYVIPIILVLWFALTCTAIGMFLLQNMQVREKVWPALALGGAFLFVVLLLSPDVPQSLYWWAGMRPYTMPLIIITLYAILFHWYMSRQRGKYERLFWLGISFAVAVFNGGLSETFTPVLIVFFACLTGWNYLTNKARFQDQDFQFQFAGLVGSITALIIMVSAPGNAIRRSFLPPPPDLFTVLQIALSGYYEFLLDIVNTQEKIVGLLGLLLGAIWVGMQFKPLQKQKWWFILIFLFGSFVFAFGCFPPGAYGLAEPPPTRTHIIPDFILSTGFLASGFIAGTWLEDRLSVKYKMGVNLVLFILVAGAMGFSSAINSSKLYALQPEYAEYAQEWDQVDAILLQASQTDPEVVYIPVLTNNWAHIFNPSDNPKFYVNSCIAEYYHVNKVIAVKNPPTSSP
jgi:hypothetical protein